MKYDIDLRIHNRFTKRWKWVRVVYDNKQEWSANVLPFSCKMHSYIWLKQPHHEKE